MPTQKNSGLLWLGLGALAFLALRKPADETPGENEVHEPGANTMDDSLPAPDNENNFPAAGDSHAESIDTVVNAKDEKISDTQAIEKGKVIAAEKKNAKVVVKKRNGKHVIIRSGTKRIKPAAHKKKKIKYVAPKKKHAKKHAKKGLKLPVVNQSQTHFGIW